MSSLPTGTVTFLFTDIEGSTKRWEQYPQAMQAALQRHDAILRETIEQKGGYVFKTVGDAFYAAFPTPLSALQAAVQAQRALQAEEWSQEIGSVQVRMGLHTGMVEQRDGDYFGQPLNRVARLLSAGHGGQVLLSAAIQELVRDQLPVAISLKDMGEHRLKDLIRPEHVFQVAAPGLSTEFAPLKTLDNRPNNLPVQLTHLIGREKEVAEVASLLQRDDVRLVTLTGPGGTGKTRLSLQVGADLLDEFSQGVWFVELAALVEANLVVTTIASTLAVKEIGGTPHIDTLKEYLKEKKLLLVLDNFEQVVEAASVVAAIMKATSNVKLLITSRMRLNVYGEHEYQVPALSLPDARPGHLPTLEKLTQYEAVRLFTERAQAARADFQVTNDNAPAVAQICVRLDGLPLAIELAAARIRMLPPYALLSRLSSRLKMLTGGARDLPARQQTLRGAIEWSYDLLHDGEKQLFRRMAVFQGGRTLEALEAVCNYDGQLQVEVFDGVDVLLSSSLLQQREGPGGEPRFWMLETIHEYAREKLEESGEAAALEKEHALYFMRQVEQAEQAEPQTWHASQKEQLDWSDEEQGNIRAALQWSKETNTPEAKEVALRIVGATWRFWYIRGYLQEGREQLTAVLSLQQPIPPSSTVPTEAHMGSKLAEGAGGREGDAVASQLSLRARALNGAGNVAWAQGDYDAARSLHEQALDIRRALGDKQGIASSLNNLGNVAARQGDYAAARALYQESLGVAREIGSQGSAAMSLNNMARVAQEQGDYAAAQLLSEQSLAIQRDLGEQPGIAASLANLGVLATIRGDYAKARFLLEESLALHREVGDKAGIASSLNLLGNVDYDEGDYATAHSLLEQSFVLFQAIGFNRGIASSLQSLGLVALRQQDYATARSLLEQALALTRVLGDKKGTSSCLSGLGVVASMGVGGGRQQLERAARLFGAAEGLLEAISVAPGVMGRQIYTEGVNAVRVQLSKEAFDRAWAEGRAMSMEQAIEYALEEKLV